MTKLRDYELFKFLFGILDACSVDILIKIINFYIIAVEKEF